MLDSVVLIFCIKITNDILIHSNCSAQDYDIL